MIFKHNCQLQRLWPGPGLLTFNLYEFTELWTLWLWGEVGFRQTPRGPRGDISFSALMSQNYTHIKAITTARLFSSYVLIISIQHDGSKVPFVSVQIMFVTERPAKFSTISFSWACTQPPKPKSVSYVWSKKPSLPATDLQSLFQFTII